MNKVTLFLMSEKGYVALQEILRARQAHMIELIVVGVDQQVSNDYSTEILDLTKENGLPAVLRNSSYTVKTTYAIAISWRWMIPTDDAFELITIHDSLLPKYRGFAPLVNQLINKEKKIGISAILSSKEYDKGDIIFQTSTAIEYPIKIKEAITMISKLYAEVTLNIMRQLASGEPLSTVSQNEDEATYSLWRNEDDYVIDWSQKASYIRRFIDAVGIPYNGAMSKIAGEKIRVIEAIEEQDVQIVNRDCGKVIFTRDGCPIVVCGAGLLRITNAIYEDSGASILPLKKFRTRFI